MIIEAAGAVVLAERPQGRRVAAVHRPRYDDVTLPKGKLDRGETAPVAAVREVAEETGLAIRLGMPLDEVTYPLDGGDTKRVRYWVGHLTAEDQRPADAEVDEVLWLDPETELDRLSHEHDRELVRQALALPATTTLVILRHGKATPRKEWPLADVLRPLAPLGERQASAVVPVLAAYAPTVVLSSAGTRCMQTVLPYAASLDACVVGYTALTEEVAKAKPAAARLTMLEIAQRTAELGHPTLVCGHRPVLPIMQAAVGAAQRKLAVADLLVAHLDADGRAVAVELESCPD